MTAIPASTAPALPEPRRPRWQPLRAGLVDIFYYDHEELWFRDGNLLLRGNNGTGKSKVLALTLPFLLDGQLTPARVEPDGDPGKRMEWNLLLGGEYDERLGYVWLELGRLDESGRPHYCTVGCGLRAVAGRGSPESWFFTTEARVGEGFWLLDGNRRTLSRERLTEALDGRGQVYRSAHHYRRAVDERLFRLGEARYDALVNLLIQLRQPQLAKRPDERTLSAALTEALPPLDQAVLNDVADAFRNLEAERDELKAVEDAREGVGAFLVHYRAYAGIAARRRARGVRQAQSAFDRTGGELREAGAELDQAAQAHNAAKARETYLERRLDQARAQLDSLRASPEMRDAQRLHELQARAAELKAAVEEARGQAAQREDDVQRRAARLERLTDQARAAAAEVDARARAWQEHAREAGLARPHARALVPLDLPDGSGAAHGGDPRVAAAGRECEELAATRRREVGHLTRLNQALATAEAVEARARETRQAARDLLEHLAQRRLEAEEAVRGAGEALVTALRRFLEGTRELRLADPEPVLAELADWAVSLDGDNPAGQALREALRLAGERLSEARAVQRGLLEEADQRLAELEAERERLLAGEHAEPPVPYVRGEGVRQQRPGAPLWQLVDFREDLPAADRAGLEAALEGSGLLDAWLMPDGALLEPGTWDTVLVPERPAPRGLDTVLVAAVDRADPCAAAVTDPVVAAVLAGIGWGEGEHPAWVDGDGRWRLGPARGQYAKLEAQYIGRGAREAARRRRLAELEGLLGEARGHRLEISAELERLEARRRTLDAEWQAAPDDAELRRAHDEVGRLLHEQGEQQARVHKAEQALRQAREAAEAARYERDRTADDLRLPVDPADLEAVAAAVNDYITAAAGFWPTLKGHWERLADLAEARQDLEQTRERLAAQRLKAEAAEAERRSAEERWHTLRETVGARVEELQRRIRETEQRAQEADAQLKANREAITAAATREAQWAERVRQFESDLAQRDQARREAVDALAAFAGEGLLRTAVPELAIPQREGPWPLDASVRLARQVEQALHALDDSDAAWRRQQKGLHEHYTALANTLSRHGHQASAEQSGDLLVVRIVFQGRPCGPDELAVSLAAEADERRALLDARERDLLEEHLIADVAGHLQVLIAGAERMVEDINGELEKRPTSTGMRLRLAWVPLDEATGAAPAGLAQARKRLLRQAVAAWSADDRRAVGEFLHTRIQEVRGGEAAGSLVALLGRALDYRRWHRFTVERWQGGRWRPAYGPASGGERALVVTLPLFAAASSHYGSASPLAPRLVMLDEAFAGIDDDARAKCLGLMSQFDLDFMLTSEREWGCYAAVPGLAICQLVRREGIDAVYVSRWTWDGHRRERAEVPQTPSLPPAEAQTAEGEARQGSLL